MEKWLVRFSPLAVLNLFLIPPQSAYAPPKPFLFPHIQLSLTSLSKSFPFLLCLEVHRLQRYEVYHQCRQKVGCVGSFSFSRTSLCVANSLRGSTFTNNSMLGTRVGRVIWPPIRLANFTSLTSVRRLRGRGRGPRGCTTGPASSIVKILCLLVRLNLSMMFPKFLFQDWGYVLTWMEKVRLGTV